MKKKERNEDANWQIFSFSVFSFYLPFLFFFCTFRLSGKNDSRAAQGLRLGGPIPSWLSEGFLAEIVGAEVD